MAQQEIATGVAMTVGMVKPTAGRATSVSTMLGIGRFGGIVGSFLVAELTAMKLSAELQELGAWKSAEMVRRYAHFAPEQLRAAAEKLATLS